MAFAAELELELDHFLGKHGDDICLLNENHLRQGKSFGSKTKFVTVQTGL